MKKFLTVLLAVLALVSLFAAEAQFSISPSFKYTGKVSFEFLASKDGMDLKSTLSLDDSFKVSLKSTEEVVFGVKFGLTYDFKTGATAIPVNFSIKTISFKTPYFEALYTNGRTFVSDYFTGREYKADGSVKDWQKDFKADFNENLKLVFPFSKDFALYYVDRSGNDPANDQYFSDMILAKYTMPAATPLTTLEIVGGLYEATPVTAKKYEMGAVAKAGFDFGIVKPSVEVFGGYTQEEEKLIYSVFAKAEIKPVDILTITPEFKYTENLGLLDYKSSNIEDAQYVQANVTYQQTFKPVTLTASITPKYEFGTPQGTPTVSLDEVSAKVEYGPVIFEAKLSEKDLIDSKMEFGLYTKATFKAEMFSATGEVKWADIMKFDQYEYIHVNASATVDALSLEGNFRMVTTGANKMGYNVKATYTLAKTDSTKTYIEGFVGNLEYDATNDVWNINSALDNPKWYGKLVYSAKF